MGSIPEYLIVGAKYVSRLESFPIFFGYVLMILLAGQWKRLTKPLDLRPCKTDKKYREIISILGSLKWYMPLKASYKRSINLTSESVFLTQISNCNAIHDVGSSVLSLYTLYGFGVALYQAESSFGRQTSEQLKFVYKVYWFAKTYELLDTLFMVLRHKQRQISFLHVYHHGSMLILSDICYNFYPYAAITSYLGLNSAVHVLLYFYYGLSALHPDNPPQWKEFLTQFQIIQFVIDLIHATIGYMYHNYCIYGIFYCIAMIILFSNFYFKAYSKQRGPRSKSETKLKAK